MSGLLVFSMFRCLTPDKLAAVKQMFTELEHLSICKQNTKSSPLHIVVEKDGSCCPCGDYRHLNMSMEPDPYQLPIIPNVTSFLHKAKIFSKLNLL